MVSQEGCLNDHLFCEVYSNSLSAEIPTEAYDIMLLWPWRAQSRSTHNHVFLPDKRRLPEEYELHVNAAKVPHPRPWVSSVQFHARTKLQENEYMNSRAA